MPIRVYYEVLNQKGTPALYSDNYANRPTAGYTGRIFYSPDTAQIFYDTGSTWTLLADAGVGSGSLASVCANGNTTATGISITAGGLSTNSLTSTNLTEGSIPFIGTGGLFSQDNTNLFWDNTTKWLGLNTNTPTAPLDVHTTNNVGMQINNTTTADSKIAFLNAGVGKWRIGNLYSGGSNLFHIWNNTLNSAVITINSVNTFTYTGTTGTATIFNNGAIYTSLALSIAETGVYTTTSSSTTINMAKSGAINQIVYTYSNSNYSVHQFTNSGSYTYTYPAISGTITTIGANYGNVLLKCSSSTIGSLVPSMLSDDGTTLTSVGATRSNLYIKAANNTYYSQLAFTNGSNGSYGGISYNNANQWMQFEVNTSEYMRIYGNGNLRVFTSSSTDNGSKFQVEGVATISTRLLLGKTTTTGYTLEIEGFAWYNKSDGFFSAYGYNGAIVGNIGTANQLVSGGSTGNFAIDAVNNLIFSVNATETMRVRGNVVGIGGSNPAIRLFVRGFDQTSGYYTFYTDNGVNDLFWVRNDGLHQAYGSKVAEIFRVVNGRNVSGDYAAVTQLGSNCNNTGSYHFIATTGGADKCYIYGNGNIVNVNNSYGTLSDMTLKENIIDATPKLEDLLKLKVRSFNFIDSELKQLGFIAQEFEEVFPSMVDLDERTNKKTIKTSVLVPMLVKAVQELYDKIENLN